MDQVTNNQAKNAERNTTKQVLPKNIWKTTTKHSQDIKSVNFTTTI